MGLLCSCPPPNSLPGLWTPGCPETMGQIQRIIFQRIYNSFPSKNFFNQASPPVYLRDWEIFFDADDSSRMVITPYIHNPVTDGGEAITYGGNNQTIDGIPIVLGGQPVSFSADLLQMPQTVVKIMKTMCMEELGVYLVDQYGRIACLRKKTSDEYQTYAYFPIPIKSLFISDKKLGGYDAADSNRISFSFVGGYSDDLFLITPEDFNALSDLAVSDTMEDLIFMRYGARSVPSSSLIDFSFGFNKKINCDSVEITIAQALDVVKITQPIKSERVDFSFQAKLPSDIDLENDSSGRYAVKFLGSDGEVRSIFSSPFPIPATAHDNPADISNFYLEHTKQGTVLYDIDYTRLVTISHVIILLVQEGVNDHIHINVSGKQVETSGEFPLPKEFNKSYPIKGTAYVHIKSVGQSLRLTSATIAIANEANPITDIHFQSNVEASMHAYGFVLRLTENYFIKTVKVVGTQRMINGAKEEVKDYIISANTDTLVLDNFSFNQEDGFDQAYPGEVKFIIDYFIKKGVPGEYTSDAYTISNLSTADHLAVKGFSFVPSVTAGKFDLKLQLNRKYYVSSVSYTAGQPDIDPNVTQTDVHPNSVYTDTATFAGFAFDPSIGLDPCFPGHIRFVIKYLLGASTYTYDTEVYTVPNSAIPPDLSIASFDTTWDQARQLLNFVVTLNYHFVVTKLEIHGFQPEKTENKYIMDVPVDGSRIISKDIHGFSLPEDKGFDPTKKGAVQVYIGYDLYGKSEEFLSETMPIRNSKNQPLLIITDQRNELVREALNFYLTLNREYYITKIDLLAIQPSINPDVTQKVTQTINDDRSSFEFTGFSFSEEMGFDETEQGVVSFDVYYKSDDEDRTYHSSAYTIPATIPKEPRIKTFTATPDYSFNVNDLVVVFKRYYSIVSMKCVIEQPWENPGITQEISKVIGASINRIAFDSIQYDTSKGFIPSRDGTIYFLVVYTDNSLQKTWTSDKYVFPRTAVPVVPSVTSFSAEGMLGSRAMIAYSAAFKEVEVAAIEVILAQDTVTDSFIVDYTENEKGKWMTTASFSKLFPKKLNLDMDANGIGTLVYLNGDHARVRLPMGTISIPKPETVVITNYSAALIDDSDTSNLYSFSVNRDIVLEKILIKLAQGSVSKTIEKNYTSAAPATSWQEEIAYPEGLNTKQDAEGMLIIYYNDAYGSSRVTYPSVILVPAPLSQKVEEMSCAYADLYRSISIDTSFTETTVFSHYTVELRQGSLTQNYSIETTDAAVNALGDRVDYPSTFDLGQPVDITCKYYFHVGDNINMCQRSASMIKAPQVFVALNPSLSDACGTTYSVGISLLYKIRVADIKFSFVQGDRTASVDIIDFDNTEQKDFTVTLDKPSSLSYDQSFTGLCSLEYFELDAVATGTGAFVTKDASFPGCVSKLSIYSMSASTVMNWATARFLITLTKASSALGKLTMTYTQGSLTKALEGDVSSQTGNPINYTFSWPSNFNAANNASAVASIANTERCSISPIVSESITVPHPGGSLTSSRILFSSDSGHVKALASVDFAMTFKHVTVTHIYDGDVGEGESHEMEQVKGGVLDEHAVEHEYIKDMAKYMISPYKGSKFIVRFHLNDEELFEAEEYFAAKDLPSVKEVNSNVIIDHSYIDPYRGTKVDVVFNDSAYIVSGGVYSGDNEINSIVANGWQKELSFVFHPDNFDGKGIDIGVNNNLTIRCVDYWGNKVSTPEFVMYGKNIPVVIDVNKGKGVDCVSAHLSAGWEDGYTANARFAQDDDSVVYTKDVTDLWKASEDEKASGQKYKFEILVDYKEYKLNDEKDTIVSVIIMHDNKQVDNKGLIFFPRARVLSYDGNVDESGVFTFKIFTSKAIYFMNPKVGYRATGFNGEEVEKNGIAMLPKWYLGDDYCGKIKLDLDDDYCVNVYRPIKFRVEPDAPSGEGIETFKFTLAGLPIPTASSVENIANDDTKTTTFRFVFSSDASIWVGKVDKILLNKEGGDKFAEYHFGGGGSSTVGVEGIKNDSEIILKVDPTLIDGVDSTKSIVVNFTFVDIYGNTLKENGTLYHADRLLITSLRWDKREEHILFSLNKVSPIGVVAITVSQGDKSKHSEVNISGMPPSDFFDLPIRYEMPAPFDLEKEVTMTLSILDGLVKKSITFIPKNAS